MACIRGNWHPLAPSSMGVFGKVRTQAPAPMLCHRAAGPEGRLPAPTLWDSGLREPSAAHTPPAPHVCVCAVHTLDFSGRTSQKVDARHCSADAPSGSARAQPSKHAFHSKGHTSEKHLPEQCWSDPTFSLILISPHISDPKGERGGQKKTPLLWREAWGAAPSCRKLSPSKTAFGETGVQSPAAPSGEEVSPPAIRPGH